MVQININGINREMTAEEQAEYNQVQSDFNATKKENKLRQIRALRNQKLQETDYLALSDNTLSVAISNYRQGLRDIPQNNTTEEEYDLLLARDVDKNLTHAIWSKP
jgi:hypothetical protein